MSVKQDIAAFLLLAAPWVAVAAPLDDAMALYQAKKFTEARVSLEKIVASEPRNAPACYYLGLTLRERGDTAALQAALPWLQKAVELQPDNADFLADYGGVCFQLAGKTRSLTLAKRGRDAVEKALRLDPGDIDTRQGLFEFYVQAPWPLGSSSKAAAQLAEIRRRAPERAAALEARLKAEARDYAAAFRLCDEVLKKNPADYAALVEFGRTAAVSGLRLDAGLVHLRQAVLLPPPNPASPSTGEVWRLIGALEEKLGHRVAARAAYEEALKLDASDADAAGALARVK